MTGRSVVVTVEADGTIKIEAVGYKGNACQKATEALERALGTVTGGSKKPEYFQANQQSQQAGH